MADLKDEDILYFVKNQINTVDGKFIMNVLKLQTYLE